MYSDNKLIRDVADVAARIMSGQQPVTEKLHPNQQKLDVHEPEKDELTFDDFKKLRAGKKADVKKEEAEQVDEAKKESKEDFDARQKRLVAAGNETAKDPERLKKLSKIPGYNAAMNLAKKSTNEEVKDEYARKVDKYLKKKHAPDAPVKEEVEVVYEANIEPTSAKSRSHISNLSNPITNTVTHPSSGKEIGIITKQPSGEYYAHHSAAKLSHAESGTFDSKDKAHQFIRNAHAKAIKNNTLSDRWIKQKKLPQFAKEEVEAIDEVKMADLPSTKVQGRSYGASKPESDYVKGPSDAALKKIEAEKKQKKFSEMVNLYQEKGLKSLSELLVKEEPDNEQFTKELEDAKAKSEGKKKNTEIAKGSVQAVKSEEIDINDINGVQMSTIEERMMTEPEKEKKEDIVKGMKKGMAGFKERYGDRAKDVMYATATKQAMK